MNGHNWSVDTVIAANLFDAIQAQSWQFNRTNGGRMRRPKPLPRPDAFTKNNDQLGDQTKGKPAPLDDIQEFLRRKNGR